MTGVSPFRPHRTMRKLRFITLTAIAASVTLAASAAAQGTADQLTFYGFINQAYGVSRPAGYSGAQ